jgi:membrane-associated protease RseP (regulator of RpoE activity)
MSARSQIRRAAALICAPIAFVSMASPAVAAGPTSLRALAAQDLRVATIGYRIGIANSGACARPVMLSGLVLHDISQYDRSTRPAVAQAFAMNGGFGVLGVVPGSVAHQAGLRSQDEIVAINSTSVEDPSAAGRDRQSYQRMDAFLKQLQAALVRGPADLIIRRGGHLYRARLNGQRGCGGQLALTPSSSLNAWSDGTYVNVSTAIVNFAGTDDELAFVIAHEMAHNILESSETKDARSGLFGTLGLGAGSVKRGEIAADSYAVSLMNNGGYRPSSAIAFLQRANRRLWWAVSFDHPGWSRRIATVAQAMALLPRPAGTMMASVPASPEIAPTPRPTARVIASGAATVMAPAGLPVSRAWR